MAISAGRLARRPASTAARLALVLMLAALAPGCAPEGAGTLAPPGQTARRDDSGLGRPFGNAPKLRAKRAASRAPVARAPNPRL
jgi:hypothetical protein